MQVLAQDPLAQTALPIPLVSEQTLPHAPQLFWSDCSVEQELPQLVKPELQLATLQAALTHCDVPFETAQALPQAPQFAMLDLRSVSQPFAGFLSQSANPDVHAMEQVPALQPLPDAFGSVWQFVPQEPQLLESRLRSSQIPWQDDCPLGHVSVSPVFCVRYSTVRLTLVAGEGGAAPIAVLFGKQSKPKSGSGLQQTGPTCKLAIRLVPDGKVSVSLP